MAAITIYQKPTCTTCKQVHQILRESGVDFESVNYYLEPIPRKKLKSLVKKMGIPAKDLLRKKEPLYRELGLAEKELSDDAVIDLLVQHPDLIQRPIVEKGDRAILARPAETIRTIL